jgi:hypothetical protein
MGLFGGKKHFPSPCNEGKNCPYEYSKNPKRDIEGMPLILGDPRSCPTYGHVCPNFLQEFNLTIEDLKIRAVIHCGALLMEDMRTGKERTVNEAVAALMQRFFQVQKEYPPEKFPQYYNPDASRKLPRGYKG